MIYSKSFGYALRSVLYIALMQNEKRNVPVEEIADRLVIPRYFAGKVLMKLVKSNILSSAKGPAGGFFINKRTLSTRLLTIMDITDGLDEFKNCVLRLHKCSSSNPCPLHFQMAEVNTKLKSILWNTTIADLLIENKKDFISSITTTVTGLQTHL